MDTAEVDVAPPPPDLAARLGVVVGGAVGTLLRAGVSALAPAGGVLPWGTLVANLSGALLLGALVGRVEHRRAPGDLVIATAGTGLLGAYTTFSALAVETVELLATDAAVGVAYAVTSIVAGLALARAGRRLGGGA